MAAVLLEGGRGRRWRALSISDARMVRRNYLYSLPPARLSAAAAVVAAELRDTARELIDSGAWSGVSAIPAGVEAAQIPPEAAPAGARASRRARRPAGADAPGRALPA
jgi:LysR family tcuABC transcriptional regulator